MFYFSVVGAVRRKMENNQNMFFGTPEVKPK